MEGQIINVEEIMRELRKESEARNMPEIEGFDMTVSLDITYAQKGEPFDPGFLLEEMELANKTFAISSDIAVEGRGRLVKKLVRKLSSFIVRQFADHMTQYNIHIVRSMNQIRNYIVTKNSADKDVAELKSLISGDIAWKIEAQSGRIRELSRENMELKKQLQGLVEEGEKKLKKQLQGLVEEGEKNRLALEKANAEIEVLKVRIQAVTDRCGTQPGHMG